MPLTIPDRLKQARTAIGETQSEFARRFPIEQPVYNRWETGERNPSAPARALIERVLSDLQNYIQDPVK